MVYPPAQVPPPSLLTKMGGFSDAGCQAPSRSWLRARAARSLLVTVPESNAYATISMQPSRKKQNYLCKQGYSAKESP